MSVSCFELSANQMMALLPGCSLRSPPTFPLPPPILPPIHTPAPSLSSSQKKPLIQLLSFCQTRKRTLSKGKRPAQGLKYILSAFLMVSELCACTHMCVHTCAHTNMHTRTCTHVHTHANAHTRARAQTRTRMCTRAHVHAHEHAHAHTHTRAHTHTGTYLCTLYSHPPHFRLRL